MSLNKKLHILGYVFVLPSILGMAVVFIPSMIMSFRFSINDIRFSAQAGYEYVPVQLSYYIDAFMVHPTFRRLLLSSISSLWVQVLIISIFSLFMSVVLNQKFKGRGFARAVLFLPVIMATGVINKVDASTELLRSWYGFTLPETAKIGTLDTFQFWRIEEILNSINFFPQMTGIILNAIYGLYEIILNSGVQILIFLAGLQTISPSIYEAARVDGITGWQAFWKITVPMISPLIIVNVIYTVIWSLSNDNSGILYLISSYINSGSQYSFASAMAWVYFVITLALIGFAVLISKKFVFYYN